MRLELRYVCILVVSFMVVSTGEGPRCAFASERSSARDRSLILRLDAATESASHDTDAEKKSETYMGQSAPQSDHASNPELRLPSLQNPLPVDPWFPGRGAIGVKLEVTW